MRRHISEERKPLAFLCSRWQKALWITLFFVKTNICRVLDVYCSCVGLTWVLHRICFANYKQGYLLFVTVRVLRCFLHLFDVTLPCEMAVGNLFDAKTDVIVTHKSTYIYYQSLLFTNECTSDCLENNIKILYENSSDIFLYFVDRASRYNSC
jgi:hypothetical protein